jgi:hypothetical protein
MESKRKEPKAPETALSQTEKQVTGCFSTGCDSQPIERHHENDTTLNQGKECPPQATAQQQHTRMLDHTCSSMSTPGPVPYPSFVQHLSQLLEQDSFFRAADPDNND